MSAAAPYFELGGVVVPIESQWGFRQDYEPLAADTWPPMRTLDGTGVRQTVWTGKLRTTLSARGWLPAGLDGLDYRSPMLLKCAQARGITSATNAVTLPAARRSDTGFEPYGGAIVAGQYVESPVSLSGNVATVTAVPGASAYVVFYYPEITVHARPPRTHVDLSGRDAEYGWTIEAEEV